MYSQDQKSGPSKKLTAVGVAGEMGQLFTVYEKNWHCNECKQENYPTKTRCFRCKKPKDVVDHDYAPNKALEALQRGEEIFWQEVMDPTSLQVYYYNKQTGVTQWERPEELGPAPMSTGWFGRGQAGSTAARRYNASNARYLENPARKQKDMIDPKKYHTEGTNEYNIWYGKYEGDRDRGIDKDPASDRCILEKDAGYTKADTNPLSRKDRRCFCLHFARGMCSKGSDCVFYHRIPLPEDDAKCDELFDCFGRQRHRDHRDDMNGTGSFMKPSRTLFVGNLNKSAYNTIKDLEDSLWQHFGEWGELEDVSVVPRLNIAFPRFRLRTSAGNFH